MSHKQWPEFVLILTLWISSIVDLFNIVKCVIGQQCGTLLKIDLASFLHFVVPPAASVLVDHLACLCLKTAWGSTTPMGIVCMINHAKQIFYRKVFWILKATFEYFALTFSQTSFLLPLPFSFSCLWIVFIKIHKNYLTRDGKTYGESAYGFMHCSVVYIRM